MTQETSVNQINDSAVGKDAPQGTDSRSHCENGELAQILGKKLESRGLDFELSTYPDGGREGEHVEEIVVINPRARERGEVRVGDDGSVTWEYFGKLDQAGAEKILDEITNALRATGLRRWRDSPA
jgi:hypothetical protein